MVEEWNEIIQQNPEMDTKLLRPLRPRYKPFHHPVTNAKKKEGVDERDIWQILPPDVAEFLWAKRALAVQLRQKHEREMSDSQEPPT